MSSDEAVLAADGIEDYAELYARQMGYQQYNILHLKDGESNTVHQVDLQEMTCEPVGRQLQSCGEACCKHLSVALFESSKKLAADEEAVRDLGQYVRDVRSAALRIERAATGREADAAADAGSTPRGSGDADSGSGDGMQSTQGGDSVGISDPVEPVREWLEENFVAPNCINVSEGMHAGEHGVQFEPDYSNLTDSQQESFKGLVKSPESGTLHHLGFGIGDSGDEPCPNCGNQDGGFYYMWTSAAIREVCDL